MLKIGSETDLRQRFQNNSNCYADTWKETDNGLIEGEVILAMTEDRFVDVVTNLLSDIMNELESVRLMERKYLIERLKTKVIVKD